jgi:hypothetical protein
MHRMQYFVQRVSLDSRMLLPKETARLSQRGVSNEEHHLLRGWNVESSG